MLSCLNQGNEMNLADFGRKTRLFFLLINIFLHMIALKLENIVCRKAGLVLCEGLVMSKCEHCWNFLNSCLVFFF